MTSRYYYLGNDGKEYFELEDAKKYGGGVKGKRFHNPVKTYEPVYETESVQTLTENVPVATPATASMALSDFDNLDVAQLKEILRGKGYIIKGNPKRETLLEQIKKI